MKNIFLFLSFSLVATQLPPNSPRITIHRDQDITITIPEDDKKLDFHEMLKELDSHLADPEAAQFPPKNCRQRIFQNRTALIAGCATLGSATIAGTIALIVHFTAS